MSKKDSKLKDEEKSKKPPTVLSSKPGPIKVNYDDFKGLMEEMKKKDNEKAISQNQNSIQNNFAEIQSQLNKTKNKSNAKPDDDFDQAEDLEREMEDNFFKEADEMMNAFDYKELPDYAGAMKKLDAIKKNQSRD